MRIHRCVSALLLSTFTFAVYGVAQTKRLIASQDCVTARYLNDDGVYLPVQINRQSTRIAYVVKKPNLKKNRNDIQLFVKALGKGSNNPGNLVLVSRTISQIHWDNDGEHLYALATDGTRVVVSVVDAVTGERKTIATGESDIEEYTIDAKAETIVFATDEHKASQFNKPTSKQVAEGYRIPFQEGERTQFWSGRRLFLTKRSVSGAWSKPQVLTIRSPFTARGLQSFAFTPNLRLSISPNGKRLAFTYMVGEHLPTDWSNSPSGKQVLDEGEPVMTLLLVDLETMVAALPFKTVWAYSVPLWSTDSKSFAIVSESPISSSWEQRDVREGHLGKVAHLFWIEPDSGIIEEIATDITNVMRGPLWWGDNGDMLVQLTDSTFARLSRDGGVWHELGKVQVSWGGSINSLYVVSDGSNLIGERQGPATPPELVWYNANKQHLEVLARLDPQFDMLTLATAKRVEWETSTGYKISGLLFVPPDFSEKHSYPLVIHTYHEPERFFCDAGEGHWPSFVPQPLADSGILYLIRTGSDEIKKQDLDHRPPDYPGGIGEAALQTDIWDSAVQTFARLGWVDTNRVGIIGFSRSGWYTEFVLAHSKVSYAAATDTDNITYGLGEYWLRHTKGFIQGFDQMYGGNPYGEGLQQWQKYSPTFNIDKMHTPLLMEEMGYGVPYDDPERPPSNLVSHFELFTGLNRLNVPVELYYYPMEDHTPDHPQARLASLQRNVDWYRFWLQGYERPNPEDSSQYNRWRHLKEFEHRSPQIDTATPAASR